MFESKKTVELWVSCGDDYFYGQNGEKKDFEMAVSFYEKAAKKKHARATFMLGLCYELGGKGIKKDLKAAETWFQKAAELGDEDAQKRLASGQTIVPPPPPEDDEDEDDEIESEDTDDEEEDDDENDEDEDDEDNAEDDEEAAEPGKGGETYYDDDIDVDLRTLSADLLNKTGNAYYDGNLGKEENKEKAMRYYLKAAEKGDIYAMCNVGRGYYYSTGVEEDNHKTEY
jgi:TPR repeat protein